MNVVAHIAGSTHGVASIFLGWTLQQWSYVAPIVSAITAVVFVAFGVYQLAKLRKQVILSASAVTAAEDAADAAKAAALETARTRIDEQAPRVTALSELPQWPPRVSRSWERMPYANQTRLLDLLQSQEAGGEEFIFPETERMFMLFVTRGVLINEGRGTARVRLDGEGRFIEGESPLIPGRKIPCPPDVGAYRGPEYLSREHLLRPGEVALFEWAYGHPLKEWAEKHDQGKPPECSCTIVVFDSTEYGVLDHIKIELGARPLKPVQARHGHWRLTAESNAYVTVWPTQRDYRSEKQVEKRS